MSTTIVGIFNSRQQADDALYSLRNQLATKNVSIILRNEEIGTGGSNSSKMSSKNMSSMSPMPMSLLNELSQDVMQLGGTVGTITGRLATATLSAGLTLPALIFSPLLQNAMNPMTSSTMSSGMQSGSMGTSGSVMGCGNALQGSSQDQNGKIMITIQSEEHLTQATDIMLDHGAEEINTYTT